MLCIVCLQLYMIFLEMINEHIYHMSVIHLNSMIQWSITIFLRDVGHPIIQQSLDCISLVAYTGQYGYQIEVPIKVSIKWNV